MQDEKLYTLKDMTIACAMYSAWDATLVSWQEGYAAANECDITDVPTLYDATGFGDVEAMRFFSELAPDVNAVLAEWDEKYEGVPGVVEYEIAEPFASWLFDRAIVEGDNPQMDVEAREVLHQLLLKLYEHPIARGTIK